MDWLRYRTLCDRPDVCSRWLLERTLAVVDEPVAGALRRILATEPLVSPADHVGPPSTDMFVANLDGSQVRAVLAAVNRAAVEGRLAGALDGRSSAHFVAAWREYAHFVSVGPDVAED